ncbi:MAG: class I SAM-dependent methyltransferase, partial [Anaerolineae bacterium]|nr:class I SAM-dependent methyltransferase [Anaerolineae bacterium]
RKYGAGEGPANFQPKEFLVEHDHLLVGGRALDVACGFGGNALYLAERGYHADAIDISDVGLAQAQREARQRGLQDRIQFIQADMDRWWVPPRHYDLILVFFYLNRGLMPQLAGGLRPGGLLFERNRNVRYLQVRPDFDPGYLLEIGELRQMALDAGLKIVYYAEGTPQSDSSVRLIARAPG